MRTEFRDKIRIYGNPAFEVWNFINGKRSVLEITNAVNAEYSGVHQGRNLTAMKFAYEVEKETRIITLKDVLDYLEAMEAVGIVSIKTKED